MLSPGVAEVGEAGLEPVFGASSVEEPEEPGGEPRGDDPRGAASLVVAGGEQGDSPPWPVVGQVDADGLEVRLPSSNQLSGWTTRPGILANGIIGPMAASGWTSGPASP